MAERGSRSLLSPSTPEFAKLEYALQLACCSTYPRINQAQQINNPHLTTQFDRQCSNILTTDCWIDSSLLQGLNSTEDITKKGFKFNQNIPGFKIIVGSIQSNSTSLVYCKVGIGRAFVCDEQSALKMEIPEGYNSFYLKDTMIHQTSQNNVYSHEYYIKDASQILPQFIVQYDRNTPELSAIKVPVCDNCELSDATLYCESDQANLCQQCDTKLHTSKLASRHTRVPIGSHKKNHFGKCKLHDDKSVEFFCAYCNIPVCVNCKMVGNHAVGESAKHPLISVLEAYNTVLKEAEKIDPVLAERQANIKNQSTSIENRVLSVEKMQRELQAEIDLQHAQLTADLNSQIQYKLDVLLGDELELARQDGEINRLKSFLSSQIEGDATQFLFNWSKHQKVTSELHDFKYFKEDLDVQLDLKVSGNSAIVVDQTISTSIQQTIQSSKPQKDIYVSPSHDTVQVAQLPESPLKNKRSIGGMVTGDSPKVANQSMFNRSPTKAVKKAQTRRTSDFFSEAIGAFDAYDSYSMSGDNDSN